jgi:hypothetical protein
MLPLARRSQIQVVLLDSLTGASLEVELQPELRNPRIAGREDLPEPRGIPRDVLTESTPNTR